MKTVALGEIAEIVSGATPKTGVAEFWDGDVEWATPADLSRLGGPYISATPRKITEAAVRSCATTVLPAGSVLLSSRAPIGHVAINTVPMATNQGFKSLVPSPAIDAKYLYHWLKSKTAYLQSLGNGATFKELSKKSAQQIQVPLPGPSEQRRIAAILDHADALRAKRRQVLTHLDSLTQSIFHDMFEDARESASIGDLAESTQYGSSAKAGRAGKWPILRMGNVTYGGRLDLDDLKFLDLSPKDVPKYTVRRGDLLFNRTNSAELVGKTCVVDTDRQLAFAGYLIRARFARPSTSLVVSGYLNSPHGKATLRGMAKAIVGQANINATELRTIRVPVASAQEEAAYANHLARVDAQRAAIQRALAADDELFASLQSRAFRGEL